MNREGEKIHGRLITGEGQGRHFTRLDWARRQFMDKLGIDPFPGTINLVINDSESMSVWGRLKATPGVRIENPKGGALDCNARCYRVSIGGKLDGAIVLPEVVDYEEDRVEIIAAIGIRSTLNINDGDSLILEIP